MKMNPQVEQLVTRQQSQAPLQVEMACADEDFALRKFSLNATADETTNGEPDYSCDCCGWLQLSPRAGGQELLNLGTWDSAEANHAFALRVAQQLDSATILASAHAALEASAGRTNGHSAAIDSPRG